MSPSQRKVNSQMTDSLWVSPKAMGQTVIRKYYLEDFWLPDKGLILKALQPHFKPPH